MNVFIITAVPFPFGMAPTNRIKCYAKALIEEGVNCKVLCFRRTELVSNTQRDGTHEGVPYHYIGRKSIRPHNKILGILIDVFDHVHLLLFLLCHLQKNDIVFSYGSTLHYGNMIIAVAHLKGGVFVRDLVEIPNVTSNDTLHQQHVRRAELERQFPRYDGVIAISSALKNMAEKHIGKSDSVLKIPILVDYDKYCLEDKSDEFETPFVFHSGTLSDQKDGFSGMIEAFGKAVRHINKTIHFISTGHLEQSPQKEKIKDLIQNYHLEDKLMFTGYLSDKELKNYLMKASLVIINKNRTEQNEYCFSTKLGEYMAAGKPVIITRMGEAVNWLTDKEDVLFVEPENTEQLSEAITELFSNKTLRKSIANNARITCKNSFDYHNYGRTIVNFFNNLINKNIHDNK